MDLILIAFSFLSICVLIYYNGINYFLITSLPMGIITSTLFYYVVTRIPDIRFGKEIAREIEKDLIDIFESMHKIFDYIIALSYHYYKKEVNNLIYNLEESDFIYLNGIENAYLFDIKVTYFVKRNGVYDIHNFDVFDKYINTQLDLIEVKIKNICNNKNYNLDKNKEIKSIVGRIRESILYTSFRNHTHRGFADNSKHIYFFYKIFIEFLDFSFICNNLNLFGKEHKFDSINQNINFFKSKKNYYTEWYIYKRKQLSNDEVLTAIYPSFTHSYSENLAISLMKISSKVILINDAEKNSVDFNRFNTIFVFIDADSKELNLEILQPYSIIDWCLSLRIMSVKTCIEKYKECVHC